MLTRKDLESLEVIYATRRMTLEINEKKLKSLVES